MRIDDELGINHAKQLEFVHHRCDALFVHDSCLEHFLHGELRVVFSFDSVGCDSPDLAKSASSDGILVLE